MKRSPTQKIDALLFLTTLVSLGLVPFGCATPYLKGLTPQGEKVYLGIHPMQETEAYQSYLLSSKSEAAKLNYLLDRIKEAKELTYYHNGGRYSWLEAYRAGTWVVRHHYEKGEDARSFIRKETLLYEKSAKPNAIQFPDGSIHIAYFVLLNELDSLEEAA
ncbi:MAG: hypothetical protein HY584_02110 [Candidatus Omnitrophica bacterium]|nr:hypothetical protein [Candidatus Omnitrophota bacterium]